LRVLMY